MSCDTATARQEMHDVAAGALVAFSGVVVQYDGVDSLEPPDGDVDWVRVSVRHDDGGQGSLSGPTSGKIRWRRFGRIMVECYARQAPTDAAPGDMIGVDKAMLIASAVRNAYQGTATTSGVWFRNCSSREVGPDKAWYQANASIAFEYDEVN